MKSSIYMHRYAKPKAYIKVYLILAAFSVLFAFLTSKILIPYIEELSGADFWYLEIPSVLGYFSILYGIFDTHLWKVSFINQFLDLPNLNGQWKGTLQSSFNDYSVDYPHEFIIDQTFSKIHIFNEVETSESHSIMGAINRLNSKYMVLKFEYLNEPTKPNPSGMVSHYGVNTLKIYENGTKLKGEYYTDKNRKTHGNMRLVKVES